MISGKFILTLPPEGAARMVSLHLYSALCTVAGKDNCKVFDTLTYQNAFSKMMRLPDQSFAIDLLNQSLVISALDFSATIAIIPALCPVTLFTLNLLKKQNLKTVHWFYEDYRRAPYWNDVLQGYDLFCAIQKGPVENQCHKLSKRYLYLPTSCTVPLIKPDNPVKTTDIAFIGIPSPYRITTLEKLKSCGFSLAIAGNGWESYSGVLDKCITTGRWINERDSLTILQSARIGLNLSFNAPDDPENTHLSPRVFDILAAGTVLVTENVPLADLTLTDCHYFTFDYNTLEMTIAKALEIPDYSSYIQYNFEQIRQFHTMESRVRTLLSNLISQDL